MNRFQSRTGKVNIDRVSDAMVPANDEVLTYDGAGRLATAPATDTLRFPGQYYQLEDGLAYNWHRSYDASLGRYTQPDPLGFVDGPSLYGYAGQSPLMMVDPWGLQNSPPPHPDIPGGPWTWSPDDENGREGTWQDQNGPTAQGQAQVGTIRTVTGTLMMVVVVIRGSATIAMARRFRKKTHIVPTRVQNVDQFYAGQE
jgi:RHS repeat-associated protein